MLVGADSDAWAIETHAANMPGLTWCGDLTDPNELLQTLDVWGIDHVDLVAGGVPCQPFSRAGRSRIDQLVASGARNDDDPRARLWESFVEIVARLQPRAVLVENVPDLPRWDDGAVLLGFYESLGALGYAVEARVLDGFRWGVPQHRQRLILVGLRDGHGHRWPEPTDELTSLRDAIGDLPIIPRAQRAESLPYDPDRTSSTFQHEMRAGLVPEERRVIHDHITRDVRPDDLEAFSLLGEGGTYIDLPERLRRYRSDVFTDKYKRLDWNELCRSITAHIAKDGYWYIHPDQHRTLSVREAARVQTFPDGFRFAGTQTHRYRQIGNAVPVKLGQVVGEAILASLASAPAVGAGRQATVASDLLRWQLDRPASEPWREGDDPWLVLLAELTLKRKRRSELPALYRQLARIAPTPKALARHPEQSRERLAQLGLGAGATLAVDAATTIAKRFGGEVPDDEVLLRMIPGVGDYVCQAVRCFGFGRRTVLLDHNTGRVAARLHGHSTQRRFQLRLDLYRDAGPGGPGMGFNRALLDLGTSICRPVTPLCDRCPLAGVCVSSAAATAPATAQMELAELETLG